MLSIKKNWFLNEQPSTLEKVRFKGSAFELLISHSHSEFNAIKNAIWILFSTLPTIQVIKI